MAKKRAGNTTSRKAGAKEVATDGSVPEQVAPWHYLAKVANSVLTDGVKANLSRATSLAVLLLVAAAVLVGVVFVYQYLRLPPLSRIVSGESRVTDNAVAPAPPSEVFVVEEDWFDILDVSVSADIISLDNVYWTPAEQDTFNMLKEDEAFSTVRKEIEVVQRGFGIKWIKDQQRYRTNATYDRFLRLLESVGPDSDLEGMFLLDTRKTILQSEQYWEFRAKDVQIPIFGSMPQEAMVVLKIVGVTGQATLYSGSDQSAFAQELRKASGRESIVVPTEDGTLTVFMHKTEKVQYESRDYIWQVTLNRVSNPGKWRDAKDIIALKWSVRRKLAP